MLVKDSSLLPVEARGKGKEIVDEVENYIKTLPKRSEEGSFPFKEPDSTEGVDVPDNFCVSDGVYACGENYKASPKHSEEPRSIENRNASEPPLQGQDLGETGKVSKAKQFSLGAS